MGILITIEAGDGSGKETQSKRLLQHLRDDGYQVMRVEYPNYNSDSSALVQMYLRGEFGENADDVNPYAASVLFAVDRFASYRREWQSFYKNGGIVIADRYTTANMVHQLTKFTTDKDKQSYLEWLTHFEYEMLGLPRPDMTFALDVPPEQSIKVIEARKNKYDGTDTKDIHERDHNHLRKAYQASHFVAERYGWQRIDCMAGADFKPIEVIHQMIYRQVIDYIKERHSRE